MLNANIVHITEMQQNLYRVCSTTNSEEKFDPVSRNWFTSVFTLTTIIMVMFYTITFIHNVYTDCCDCTP